MQNVFLFEFRSSIIRSLYFLFASFQDQLCIFTISSSLNPNSFLKNYSDIQTSSRACGISQQNYVNLGLSDSISLYFFNFQMIESRLFFQIQDLIQFSHQTSGQSGALHFFLSIQTQPTPFESFLLFISEKHSTCSFCSVVGAVSNKLVPPFSIHF